MVFLLFLSLLLLFAVDEVTTAHVERNQIERITFIVNSADIDWTLSLASRYLLCACVKMGLTQVSTSSVWLTRGHGVILRMSDFQFPKVRINKHCNFLLFHQCNVVLRASWGMLGFVKSPCYNNDFSDDLSYLLFINDTEPFSDNPPPSCYSFWSLFGDSPLHPLFMTSFMNGPL